MIAPQAALSLIWLSFNAFNTFALILPMTGGGPGRGTELLGVLMYLLGFRDLDYSSAAAVMVILLLINSLLSYVYLRATGAVTTGRHDEAVLRANLG
jgi:multiple sugar transport system permease protein